MIITRFIKRWKQFSFLEIKRSTGNCCSRSRQRIWKVGRRKSRTQGNCSCENSFHLTFSLILLCEWKVVGILSNIFIAIKISNMVIAFQHYILNIYFIFCHQSKPLVKPGLLQIYLVNFVALLANWNHLSNWDFYCN